LGHGRAGDPDRELTLLVAAAVRALIRALHAAGETGQDVPPAVRQGIKGVMAWSALLHRRDP